MRGIFLGRLNAARNRLFNLPKGSNAFSTPVVSTLKDRNNSEGRLLRSKLLKNFIGIKYIT